MTLAAPGDETHDAIAEPMLPCECVGRVGVNVHLDLQANVFQPGPRNARRAPPAKPPPAGEGPGPSPQPRVEATGKGRAAGHDARDYRRPPVLADQDDPVALAHRRLL